MIYVKKSSCPEDIQKDFDLQKAKPEWNDIPEEPNKEQARILREEFFDKLNKDQLRCSYKRTTRTVRILYVPHREYSGKHSDRALVSSE